MNSYDLAVAYRIYPKVSPAALGLPFSEDKLRLSEICLRSFKQSLGALRAKVWVLLDACPEEYTRLFQKYFESDDLVLLPLPGVGNQATFGKQVDILLEQTDSELVYFAEDDYLYLSNQFPRMVEFLRAHNDVDFVTPYDHLDTYTLEIHRHPEWLRVHAGHHWRTAASTCLTFLTRKKVLQSKEMIFRSYLRNYDCGLWLSLTKSSMFNPFQLLSFVYRDRYFARVIAKAWRFGWAHLLFGKRMSLWAPIPAIATHLSRAHLSPTIDWPALMKDEAESIRVEGQRTRSLNEPAGAFQE